MKNKSSNSSNPSRSGMTLIEVVIGLALLGGLLATTLMASAKITRQLNRTKHQATAIRALETLLIGFETGSLKLNGRAGGAIENSPDLRWSTVPIANSESMMFGTRVVALKIHSERHPEFGDLAKVELLVADDSLLLEASQ